MGNPMTVREADALLTAPGGAFEIEQVEVDGRPVRAWLRAPRTIGDLLARGRDLDPDRTFLILGDEQLTHGEHFRRVESLAGVLVERFGVAKGDRVAIAMRNVPEWSVAFFAAVRVGAIAVPLNAFWNGEELAFALEDSGANVLIADGERLERLADQRDALAGVTLVGTRLDDRKTATPLPEGVVPFDELLEGPPPPDVDVQPDDLATIFYTSGTTDRPKGVLGTHRNMCNIPVGLQFVAARGMMRAGIDPATAPRQPAVILLPVPLFHGSGCHSNLIGHAWTGGTIVLMRKWDPGLALDLIDRERVTGFSGVPTMVWDLVNDPTIADRDLTSLRSVGGGGAASPPELLRRIQRFLPGRGAGTGFGMTESSALVTSIGGADYTARPTSCGVPVPIVDVGVFDDDGNELATGDVGELWMRGSTIVPGYWRRPEATAATFTDGWLHSGDLARIDDDGFVYIVDRAKDMVIRGGENISSLEVEAVLYEHPSVLEAAVFPVPHESLGEEVGAVVHLRAGERLDAEELRAYAASRLAPFKVPAHIWLRDDPLPRGDTGKMLKRALRAEYLTG